MTQKDENKPVITQKPDPYVEIMLQDEVTGEGAVCRVAPMGLIFHAITEGTVTVPHFYSWELIDEARATIKKIIEEGGL